jgi:DNA-binding CsgD family transcriptional regulator
MTDADTPFVGRAAELAVLSQSLPGKHRGTVRFITIVGDAGMGKTRLLAAFAEIAGHRALDVLQGQSMEDSGMPPNFPWMLALRPYLRKIDNDALLHELGDGVGDVATILPEFRERFSLGPIRPAPESATARYQLYDSVTRLLLRGAEMRPIVLLFDNLHAIDTSSLAMLEYFVNQIAGSNILVVGAYRESDVDRRHPLLASLGRLGRNTGFREIELAGLSGEEVAELLRRKLVESPSPTLVRAVLDQSGGNPLFVSEVGAMLRKRDAKSGRSRAGMRFQVPRSLRDVIDARLSSLPEDCCALLRTAAILGRDFEIAALARLAAFSRARVTKILQAAAAESIIEAQNRGWFRFRHALYREVLYAEHNMLARITLHRRAGEQIEDRFADDLTPHLSKLAYHFFEAVQAGCEDKAIFYCRQAAQTAALQRAYDEAVSLLDCALQVGELAQDQDLSLRLELLLEMGRAEYQAGQLSASTQTLMKAAVLAYQRAWWHRLAKVLCLFQLICQQSGYHHLASIPLHSAVLDNLSDGDVETRALVLASQAKAYRTAAQPELAATSFRRAVALARQCGDKDTLLHCLRKGNWTIGRDPQFLSEGLDVSREALVLAVESGDAAARLDSIVDIIFQLCDLGEIDEVEHQLVVLERLARSERQPHFGNLLTGFETALAILRGNWSHAVQRAQQGVRNLPMQGARGLRGRFAFQIFAISKAQGALGQLKGIARRIISDSDETSLWRPGQILLCCELGDYARARDALAALGDLKCLPNDDLLEIALVYLSESCLMLGERARAEELYERLQSYRGLNVTLPGTFMLGAASGYLAELAAALGGPLPARELFEEAIDMNTRMRAGPALARTRVQFARWLAVHGNGNEKKRVQQLIAQALGPARSMQLEPVLQAMDGIGTDTGSSRLTNRELDILRIIANGASNKSIAKSLSISHSTVTTHVRNIFRKIGVCNRTEAADFARRSGLLEHD